MDNLKKFREIMIKKNPSVLIVADDVVLQNQLKTHFTTDYQVHCANDYESAVVAFRLHEPSVVIQDLDLSTCGGSLAEGFRTLQEISRLARHTKVIVLTGIKGAGHALRAVSLGAYDYFNKPACTQALDLTVGRAFRMSELEKQSKFILQQKAPLLSGLITSHPSMLNICSKLEKIASTDVSCLLLGESGTGKELMARAIHSMSSRRDEPFIAINCAAIPDSLIESELFGHEKGSFTGALNRVIGRIESAQKGTLFLDELGDMPLTMQSKLLRFIQERVIERIGGRVEIPVDVRIVCATNNDLEQMMSRKMFREDLYFRVSEIVIDIPSLKDRGEDKLLLSRHFLNMMVSEYNRSIINFDETAIAAIDGYHWPGNVRELINKVRTATVMAEGKFVTSQDLGLEDVEALSLNLKQVREDAERIAILKALAVTNGKIASASRLLGITRPTLYDLLKRHGITKDCCDIQTSKSTAFQEPYEQVGETARTANTVIPFLSA